VGKNGVEAWQVEHLTSKHEALSSNASNIKKKENQSRHRHEYTFLKGRHTNGQYVYEKNAQHSQLSEKYKSKPQ
jgi:hypothetical protein